MDADSETKNDIQESWIDDVKQEFLSDDDDDDESLNSRRRNIQKNRKETTSPKVFLKIKDELKVHHSSDDECLSDGAKQEFLTDDEATLETHGQGQAMNEESGEDKEAGDDFLQSNETLLVPDIKRRRGRPRKEVDPNATPPVPKRVGRPTGSKKKDQIVTFIKRPIKKFQTPILVKSTDIKNLKLKMKGKRKSDGVDQFIEFRKIPKQKLRASLAVLKEDDHPMWEERNVSCNRSIHHYWETPKVSSCEQRTRVKFAKKFFMRRDWVNLCKVLCLASRQGVRNFFPLLAKYAAICMAHKDKDQFNKFMQFLVSIDDGAGILEKLSQITTV